MSCCTAASSPAARRGGTTIRSVARRSQAESAIDALHFRRIYIAANNTGGVRGQMGYIFASPVAPIECRITARNDAYFGDSPKDLAIQWCSDGIHWHTTDSPAGLTWSSGQTTVLSITA